WVLAKPRSMGLLSREEWTVHTPHLAVALGWVEGFMRRVLARSASVWRGRRPAKMKEFLLFGRMPISISKPALRDLHQKVTTDPSAKVDDATLDKIVAIVD